MELGPIACLLCRGLSSKGSWAVMMRHIQYTFPSPIGYDTYRGYNALRACRCGEQGGSEAVQVARIRGGTGPVKRIPAALMLASLLGLLAPACGGGSESVLPTPGPAGETVIRVEMRSDRFSPSGLTVRAGGDYLLELRNRDSEDHNLRIAGLDNEYGTDDDLVSDNVDPGKTGSLELRIDQPGVYDFRSDSQPVSMVGTLTVWEAPPIATLAPGSPSPTGEAESPTPTASPAGE